ncbi:MFS general substrate transporter [Aaosphaeria arxii CBS 175.79]|uniref:MFS general substrate transporter n=1 Tax=Aaosphaeria arxii CBS 175.79 TaxID=1450172 RepID=A0A6A5Y7P8_9PLEO|nr:MFS general substrate transporter [Aaosphaeria arxii CBS 175.79]KAF2021538.1 MFS general substrate transporter [Aaosphaeria arxii CBS 175.79]
MDIVANPAVQLQDMPAGASAETANVECEGASLRKTISRMTGRSRRSGKDMFEMQNETGVQAQRQAAADLNPDEQPTTDRVDEEVADTVDPEDHFPEGGLRAWSVVVAAFFLLFPSFGLMVSIGTLQDYWQQHQLSEYTARDLGWIPSVFVYLSLALGIWIGPLFDRYGPRWLALFGSIGYLAMTFLLAECSKYWHFMLCVGLLGGVAGAALTTTSLAAVAHWFKARRGLTQGIAMMGSSCGGLTIPLILRFTLPHYGYTWSIRILGFIFVVCFAIGNVLIKPRIPPSTVTKKKSIISLSIFGDLRFSLFTISVFGFEVVLFGALGILPTYATLSASFPPSTGFYLISVLNGVSCLGRILPGYAADKLGRFNTLLIMSIVTLIFMLVLWLPFGTTSLPSLYAFASLFGFGTGSWMALTPVCVGQLCRAEEFGRYYGSMYFIASLATLVCIPISGELVEVVGPQAMVGFFCVVLGLSLVAFVFSRWACLGRRWTVRAKV